MDDEIRFNAIHFCRNFYRTVFCIFMCQLQTTIAFMTMATFHNPTSLYIKTHPYISSIASIITLGILMGLASLKNVDRKSPVYFIFLFMMTLVLSFLLATSVSRYYPGLVLLVLGFVSLICFGITIFALETKINLTMIGCLLMKAQIVLLVAYIVTLIFPDIIMRLIIACAGAIMYSLYLIYVIQIVANENHDYSITSDGYILATFAIYKDLMNTLYNLLSKVILDN